jgi:hypothetical protein
MRIVPYTVVALALLVASVLADCDDTHITNVRPLRNATDNLVVVNTTTDIILNVPPRYMWGWGADRSGYCGEFSVQSTGLYFGVWISAEHSRVAANNGLKEILVSTPDFGNVAAAYRLDIAEWDNDVAQPQISTHLDWIHAHLRQGHPIIGAVFEKKPDANDEYDHIVPLVGVTTQSTPNTALPSSPATGRATNVTKVHWNDLWLNRTRVLSTAELGVTRAAWTSDTELDFPTPSALPRNVDHALAVLGLVDPQLETYRLKLTAWAWSEPDWGSEDECDLSPVLLDMSATVYGLTVGQRYVILRFEGNVSSGRNPAMNFLASGLHTKRWDFTATGSQQSFDDFDAVQTSLAVTYRAVLATNATFTPGPPTTAPRGVDSAASSTTAAGAVVALLFTAVAMCL